MTRSKSLLDYGSSFIGLLLAGKIFMLRDLRYLLIIFILLGDRIISVNGISLEDSTHEEAAQTLKRAGNELDLVISKAVTANISLLGKMFLPYIVQFYRDS